MPKVVKAKVLFGINGPDLQCHTLIAIQTPPEESLYIVFALAFQNLDYFSVGVCVRTFLDPCPKM